MARIADIAIIRKSGKDKSLEQQVSGAQKRFKAGQ